MREPSRVVVVRETSAPVRFACVLCPSAESEVATALSVAAFSYVLHARPVAVGDRVRRGDLLARFEVPHAATREAHERSMAALLEAQLLDAQRAALRDPGAASELGVRAAAQRCEQARATLQAMRFYAAGHEVRSPIDGVVSALPNLTHGASTVVVARVVQIAPLLLEIPVPLGTQMPAPGATVELTAGLRALQGRLRGIAPTADADGLVVLRVEVANEDAALPAGIRVQGTVCVGRRAGVFAPITALSGGATVWVETPDGPVARAVRVLSEGAAEVELAGVAPGTTLVVREAPSAPRSA